MTMRTEGYVSDIEYTRGFYREMSPEHLAFVCLLRNVRAPRIDRPFAYCELGCGHGLSLAVFAATHPHGRFLGVDFNPAHIAGARRLAEAAGLSNLTFREASFRSLALGHDDTDSFDIMALHGVYSWVGQENRDAIIDIVARQLKSGGLLYISYNAPPGWAAMVPIQGLITEYSQMAAGRSDDRFGAARALLTRLRGAGAAYFSSHPLAAANMDRWPTLDRRYLSHEYMNEEWRPVGHAAVARALARARLTYGASATMAENFDDFSILPAIRTLLAEIPDPVVAEAVREFAMSQGFRRDVFLRGAEPLRGAEATAALRRTEIALTVPRDEIALEFAIPLGRLRTDPVLSQAALEALAAGPQRIADLEDLPAVKGVPAGPATLRQLVCLLIAAGQAAVTAAWRPDGVEAARAFNREVAARVRFDDDPRVFAAPLIGNGIATDSIERMYYAALASGVPARLDVLADYATRLAQDTNRMVVADDGSRLTDAALIRARFAETAGPFLDRKLPLWRTLGLL